MYTLFMDKTYLQEVAERRVANLWATSQKIWPKALANVKVPEVKINARLKTTAVRAWYEKHMVEFSAELMWEHTAHFVKDTIPHEVAHIVADIRFPNEKSRHGQEWRDTMFVLSGVEPKRLHSMVNSTWEAKKAGITLWKLL